MRKWDRDNRRRSRKRPKCLGCARPILRQQPDVIFRRVDGSSQVHYHQGHEGGAMAMVMVEGPGVWEMIYRYIDEKAN